MQISLIHPTQSLGTLDFEPLIQAPASSTGFAINRVLVRGSGQSLFLNHDVAPHSQEAAQIFAGLRADLSFIELCRALQAGKKFKLFEPQTFFQAFGYTFDQRTESLLELAPKLTEPFQKWAAEKRLSPFDLASLRHLDLNLADFLMNEIARQSLSRSEGLEALTLGVEILMMGHALEKSNDSSAWLQRLREQRYPQTMARDAGMTQKLEKISWPRSAQKKWRRSGDQAGVELKIFFSSREDFVRQTSLIESQLDELWTRN